jgi:putative N6-adenine-specific DNA methylase
MAAEQDTFFVVTAPGLDRLAAEELRALGISLAADEAGPEGRFSNEEGGGGVLFRGGLPEVYRANLHLRTASRVLVRLGEFYAAAFPELRKKAGRLAWERFVKPGQPVLLHVTCHKSKLYHSGAVAERVLGAIQDRLGKPVQAVTGQEAQQSTDAIPPQLVIVRLVRDLCTISVDSSGHLLHRRGYRLATGKAPLRETLAAGLLLAAGWDAASPLLDPFCGSGTIPIEAAMLALGIPPGLRRAFAFMRWPGYDTRRWEGILSERPSRPLAGCPTIQASDRDAGAISLARGNAARAGVEECIQFETRAVSAITPPPGPGWVVTNPPYGIRVSPSKDLRNLYAQLGNVLRASCPGWQVAIVCSDPRLLGQTGLRLDTSQSFINGGVPVRLGRGRVNP